MDTNKVPKNWVSQCESEKLAFSGAIQPYGGMLYLNLEFIVTHVSANIQTYLRYQPLQLLSSPLPDSLARILMPSLKALPDAVGSRSELFGLSVSDERSLDFVISRSIGGIVIELSAHDAQYVRIASHSVPMRTPSNDASALELHNKITQLVRELTGFDRVMIYAFREDGDGEVLAESHRSDVYGSYLGLRFPASDIPQIARTLYQKNPWRLIPDSQCVAIPLLSHQESHPDLTWSDLRSVSPVHQMYLANMGVNASLSLPIVIAGELWGLIACHHATPRLLPLKLMRAANQVTKHYGLVIATWIAEKRMRFVDSLNVRYQELLILIQRQGDLISAIPEIAPVLFEQFLASGLAIKLGNVWAHTGDSPNILSLEKLSVFSGISKTDSIYMYDSLTRLNADFDKLPVSGALGLEISLENNNSLQVWLFRKEVLHDVAWGGNPDKPVEFNMGDIAITPRNSFEKWIEKRTGYSRPWQSEDRLAAMRLRRILMELYA